MIITLTILILLALKGKDTNCLIKKVLQKVSMPQIKSIPNYFNYNLISSIFKEKDYLFKYMRKQKGRLTMR